MSYTENEKREIYEFYIRNGYNAKNAVREYRRLYEGTRRIPSNKTFSRIYEKVLRESSFKRKRRTIARDENYENGELEILLYFQGIFCSEFKLTYLFHN